MISALIAAFSLSGPTVALRHFEGGLPVVDRRLVQIGSKNNSALSPEYVSVREVSRKNKYDFSCADPSKFFLSDSFVQDFQGMVRLIGTEIIVLHPPWEINRDFVRVTVEALYDAGGHPNMGCGSLTPVPNLNRYSDFRVRQKAMRVNVVNRQVGTKLAFGRAPRDFVSFTGFRQSGTPLPDVPAQTDDAGQANEGRPERPLCSVTSGVCGLPLSAKIGVTAILVWIAWGLQFRGLARLGLCGDIPRKRLYGLAEVACSFGLFGLCAFAWWWGSTY